MVITICCITPQIATASTIDDKIAMYQEENAAIEQDIDRIVEAYLKHEQDTFTDLKTEESSITLVLYFLNSSQIHLFSNNQKFMLRIMQRLKT